MSAEPRKFPNVVQTLRDLSETPRQQGRQPIHGRDAEVDAVLAGLEAGDPVVLRGPSGVGKTAIWTEVIRRLAGLDSAHPLWGLRVYAASVAELQSGCVYAGYWEEKLAELIEDFGALERSRRLVPLLLVTDFGNLFRVSRTSRDDWKPIADDVLSYVESGKLRLAGEITPEMFRPGLADDPRWLRRIRLVDVAPLEADALRGVLRQACATDLCGTGSSTERTVRAVAAGLPTSWLTGEPGPLDAEAALERALELSDRFQPDAIQPGAALQMLRLACESGAPTEAAVEAAVSQVTGVPPILVRDDLPLAVADVVVSLSARVVGQAEGVEAVASALVLAKAGLNDPRRPLGTYLFTGPSGVGKTELARAAAAQLHGSDAALVRLDMSEYFGPLSAHRFAEDLVRRLGEKRASVVLFDEIEKADLGALDILLQVCGDGRVSDGRRQASLKQSLVILTSNVGFSAGPKVAAAGQGGVTGVTVDGDAVRAALRERFRPELLGRMDRIVVFRPLSQDVLRQIVDRELRLALDRQGVRRRRLTVEVDPSVKERLADAGSDPRYGARPLQAEIRRAVLGPLGCWLTESPGVRDRVVRVRLRDGEVAVDVLGEPGNGRHTGRPPALIGRLLGI